MSDIPGIFFGIILAFVLTILAPFAIVTVTDDMMAKREIANEVTTFIDKIVDIKEIDEDLLADFQIGVNSYGPICDVEIVRYAKVVNPDPIRGAGYIYTTYQIVEDNTTYNTGDTIQVRVNVINYTGAQRVVMAIMNLFQNKFEITFAGTVR